MHEGEGEDGQSHKDKGNTYVALFFMTGVFVCMGLNGLIHKLTSQSIVHCSHDGHSHRFDEEAHVHEHSHGHGQLGGNGNQEEQDLQDEQMYNSHTHSHSHSHSSSSTVSHERKHSVGELPPPICARGSNEEQEEDLPPPSSQHIANESSALLPTQPTAISYAAIEGQDKNHVGSSYENPTLLRKKSTIQLVLDNLNTSKKDCKGIYDEDSCDGISDCVTDGRLSQKMSYDLSNLEIYRGWDESSKVKGATLVAYSNGAGDHLSMPRVSSTTSLNQVLRPMSPAAQHQQHSSHQEHHHGVPQSKSSLLLNLSAPNHVTIKTEPNLQKHSMHRGDHHHKINTPISKLLSIGMQTGLALTLHKFPEGFITYVTSEADPKLGVSIFLSLAIHNIVEGFTMVLPLYLALNSKFKAFMITFILGGLSQPLGAVAAHLTLSGKAINKENSYFMFGALMGLTCGFLTIVGLQLLISAVNFGGTGRGIIWWWVTGASVILVTGVLREL